MGSPEGEAERVWNERLHEVELSPFLIARYAISQDVWETGLANAPEGRLLEWTRRGQPRPCRRAALGALATVAKTGRWSEVTTNRVVETVAACLEPSEHRGIKTQAAQTLRVLGEQATPALSALEALEQHDPNPSVRKQAKQTVDKIRSGAAPQVELTRLRDELRKLRDANRKMRERIDRLDLKRPHDGD